MFCRYWITLMKHSLSVRSMTINWASLYHLHPPQFQITLLPFRLKQPPQRRPTGETIEESLFETWPHYKRAARVSADIWCSRDNLVCASLSALVVPSVGCYHLRGPASLGPSIAHCAIWFGQIEFGRIHASHSQTITQAVYAKPKKRLTRIRRGAEALVMAVGHEQTVIWVQLWAERGCGAGRWGWGGVGV